VFGWRWSGGEMGWPALDKEEAERQSETTIELCVTVVGHIVTPP
jgi:hypothetical protein